MDKDSKHQELLVAILDAQCFQFNFIKKSNND